MNPIQEFPHVSKSVPYLSASFKMFETVEAVFFALLIALDDKIINPDKNISFKIADPEREYS